jgi:hypoxanthine phosphoribosyltransferase
MDTKVRAHLQDVAPHTFQSFQFPGDSVTYITPQWIELDRLTLSLAEQIMESPWQPDRVVTLAKGGWPLTRTLVDYLQIRPIASVGVRFYSGINERLESPEVYQPLPVSIEGEHILLFDDVADTGLSLKFVQEMLIEAGAATVKNATLFYKPQSVIVPDFFGAETTAWIVFQFEQIEMARMLDDKWRQGGIDGTECLARLRSMGIRDEVLNLYTSYYRK